MESYTNSSVAAFPHHWLQALGRCDDGGFISTGFKQLDSELPGGGWPTGEVTEIFCDDNSKDALWITLPTLAHLSNKDKWIAWIGSPGIPHADVLKHHGVDLNKVLVVHPKSEEALHLATERALGSGNCSAVFSWANPDKPISFNRLNEAARQTNTLGMIFRKSKYGHHSRLSVILEQNGHGMQINIRNKNQSVHLHS